MSKQFDYTPWGLPGEVVVPGNRTGAPIHVWPIGDGLYAYAFYGLAGGKIRNKVSLTRNPRMPFRGDFPEHYAEIELDPIECMAIAHHLLERYRQSTQEGNE